MGGFSLTHWIILLVVVVFDFGTKKLRNTGRDLGEAVKGLQDGMKGEEEKTQCFTDKTTIDAELKDQNSFIKSHNDEFGFIQNRHHRGWLDCLGA